MIAHILFRCLGNACYFGFIQQPAEVLLMAIRMIWSFSRDSGIPFPNFFRKTSPRTSTPLRTVWLTIACSFLLGLPMLVSTVAFTAVISISSIGLQIAYGVPIAGGPALVRKPDPIIHMHAEFELSLSACHCMAMEISSACSSTPQQ